MWGFFGLFKYSLLRINGVHGAGGKKVKQFKEIWGIWKCVSILSRENGILKSRIKIFYLKILFQTEVLRERNQVLRERNQVLRDRNEMGENILFLPCPFCCC